MPTTFSLWIQASGPYTVDETLAIARKALGAEHVLAAHPVSETLHEAIFTARIEVTGVSTKTAALALDEHELTAWGVEPTLSDESEHWIEPASVLGMERA